MAYVGRTPSNVVLTSSDIEDGIVIASKIATDAVETAKVKDVNVTAGKLATTQDLSSKTITLPATVAGLGTGITNSQLAGSIDVTSKITGVVPTANLGTGTADATTFLRGDQTYAEAGGGITEADMWRLTTSITSDVDPIALNLERVDDATFEKIGTGMSVSSGDWTFPSTGLWQVFANASIGTAAVDNVYLKIEASTDSGSSYDSLVQFQQSDSVATYGGSAGGHVFVNVTDASTFRVKFMCGSLGGTGAEISGNTGNNLTYFTFIRLGDSQ